MFKANNWNTRTRCEICSKLTIKTPERHQWRRSGVFIVNFQHISNLVLVFLLLTLNVYCRLGKGSPSIFVKYFAFMGTEAAVERYSQEKAFWKYAVNLQETPNFALQIYWNHTWGWVFACKFAAYFQNIFSQEHLWMTASMSKNTEISK